MSGATCIYIYIYIVYDNYGSLCLISRNHRKFWNMFTYNSKKFLKCISTPKPWSETAFLWYKTYKKRGQIVIGRFRVFRDLLLWLWGVTLRMTPQKFQKSNQCEYYGCGQWFQETRCHPRKNVIMKYPIDQRNVLSWSLLC